MQRSLTGPYKHYSWMTAIKFPTFLFSRFLIFFSTMARAWPRVVSDGGDGAAATRLFPAVPELFPPPPPPFSAGFVHTDGMFLHAREQKSETNRDGEGLANHSTQQLEAAFVVRTSCRGNQLICRQ
jgi:hypothetical protein